MYTIGEEFKRRRGGTESTRTRLMPAQSSCLRTLGEESRFRKDALPLNHPLSLKFKTEPRDLDARSA